MKKIFSTLALLTLAASAFAQHNHTLTVSVPFIGAYVNTTDHQGLTIHYDMNKAAGQKVVCSFFNFYKGWMDYTHRGAAQSTATYGGSEIVVLTTKGETKSIIETIDQVQVDAAGTATISNTEYDQTRAAFVSCAYMPESTNPR